MSKNKKSKVKKVPQKLSHDEAFGIGWDSEQALADLICSKISEEDDDALDTAFISALQGLAVRMAHHWKKEFILDVVTEAVNNVEKEHEQHVCNDCLEKEENSLPTNKPTFH